MPSSPTTVAPSEYRAAARSLVTTVALITTTGRHGDNVMSAEWTYNISYNPMRFAVAIHPSDATHDNLLDVAEFGANFLGDDQTVLANLAGAYTGKEVAKLSSDLFKTYAAQKIRPPMISGCFLNAECRVVKEGGILRNLGDHTVFVGEVLNLHYDPSKRPLLYSQRSYWRVGEKVERKPLIYVTCTARQDGIRVDGRLSGVEHHGERVELEISSEESGERIARSAPTDEEGYFEAVVGVEGFAPGSRRFTVRARWNGLLGTASTTAS